MNPTSESEASREGCCPESASVESCAASQAGDSCSSKPSGISWSKTGVFAVVMLAALGVGGYSFSKKAAAGSGEPEKAVNVSIADEETESSVSGVPGTDASPVQAPARSTSEEHSEPSNTEMVGSKSEPAKELLNMSIADTGAGAPLGCVVTDGQSTEASGFSCGESLDSLKDLGEMAAGKETVFMLLPGEEEESTRALSQQIEKVTEKLAAKGKQVAVFTLEKDAEGYDEIIKRFSIESLPCVIVSGLGGQSLKLSKDITEESLIRAFVLANMSAPACATPCGSDTKTE